MALIACKECGKEVSTEAVACPGCGAPPQPAVAMISRKVDRKTLLIAAILVIGGLYWVATKSPGADTAPKTVTAAADVAERSDEVNKQKVVEHYYDLEQDGEYGYEQEISEDDRKSGQAAAHVQMYRYLGEKNGVYTVRWANGNQANIISCKAPCEFVTSKIYFGDYLRKTEILKNSQDSIIWAVMQDARSGKLKPAVTKSGAQ